ncbi:hypothetical protein ACI2LF_26830 [Kribbella sp. NPDC020789]
MPRPPVEQRIDSIASGDQLIRYAVAAQLSLLADVPDRVVAKAAKISDLSAKLGHGHREFNFQDLRRLDQALIALSPRNPARPYLQHTGGLRSLGARVRGLHISEVLAEAPAEWTDEWVFDPRPPRTEFELLGQASALLSMFVTASQAGIRQADVQETFARPTQEITKRLIMLGGSPPTSRNIDALIVLGGLARYSYKRVSETLETAIKSSPLGFRAWRAVSKLIRIERDVHSSIEGQLKDWVPSLLQSAQRLRATSLYPARSLDLEVAANMPLDWSPDAVRDFLYTRAMAKEVSLRERGTAAHIMWSRALDSGTKTDLAQTKKLLRADIIEGFKKSPRKDVADGEAWLAATLEVVMDNEVQVCDEFPDIDKGWQRAALKNLAAIKESALPEHLKSATYQLAQHALFQNSGVERRRAVDTLQAAGLLDPVTRAFANIISESDQTWLRIRAIFALGFMQDPSQRVQQALIDACQRSYEMVLEKDEGVEPSVAAELHASLFAVGDCFGAPGYDEEARHVRGELEHILSDLVGSRTAPPNLHLVARATGYLLTVTAQRSDGSQPDLSKVLLADLRKHKDPVTQRLSDWALSFRFAEDRPGELNAMFLAPLAATGKSRA